MKRPEMIDLISSIIEDRTNETNCERLAGEILTKMEAAGVLPPEIINPNYNSKYAQYEQIPYKINEWEK
jgi:hypothetical protein